MPNRILYLNHETIILMIKNLFLFLLLLAFLNGCNSSDVSNDNLRIPQNFDEAMQHEYDKTHDPATGTIPFERLIQAQEYYDEMGLYKTKTNAPFSNLKWQERGPNNIGGRTRAILFLSAKKVLAAGVSGGLWKTEDITATPPAWEPIEHFLSTGINITTLAQDPTSLGTIYAGTGEAFGSNFRGRGIYKSTDTGSTWSLLSSTSVSNSDDFSFVAKILVDSNNNVYAASKSAIFCNRGGLMKSSNGGSSWTRVVGTLTAQTCDSAFNFVGADLEMNADEDIFYSTGNSLYEGKIFVSKRSVHGSNTGNSGNWTDITPTGSWERIEIDVSKQANSGVIYAACEGSGSNDVTGIFFSRNKGATWSSSRTVPTICDQGSNSDYTRSQAWYDQVVKIDPSDDETVFIGGIDLLKSTDSAVSFDQITTWSNYWSAGGCTGSVPPNIHADQHILEFNPFTSNAALIGNDGGLYYSTNMNIATPTWTAKNDGYNVTQYYAIATHPSSSDYVLGGTQDNGSHKLTTQGVGGGTEVSGGDGGFCFIDQDNATYQLTSYVYNNWYLSDNSGGSFSNQSGTNINTGRFINPADLDDVNNLLFSAGSSDILEVRSDVNGGPLSRSTYNLGFNGRRLSALKVSPNNDTIMYVGDDNGTIYKIADRKGTPTKTRTWSIGSGYVSSIDVWESSSGDDDSILVTLSSYGVNSVYLTANGTDPSPTWTDLDDNNTLQDMPVRWGIFSKEGPDKIFIATDLGILGTDNINGNSTSWTLINNDEFPSVRVDMLDYDADDNLVAATHGRGIWESKDPCTLDNEIPSAAGTYTSTIARNDGSYTCFCDSDGKLLLALDTNGTGAVIAENAVGLKIGNPSTISWNNSGGIISNPDGGAIIDRKWHVSATTQPTSNVKVKYFFTSNEYDDIVSACAALTKPTTISSVTDLNFYKLTNPTTAYADPHSSGATGVILTNGLTTSTTQWVYSASGSDHSAEFLVSSFSGGGGGGGANGGALPVSLLEFYVAKSGEDAVLNWKTGIELNNKGFEIHRSLDGANFNLIGWVKGKGTTNDISDYSYVDKNVSTLGKIIYYKLKQVDFDGTQSFSDIRQVTFENPIVKVFPNPVKSLLRVEITAENVEVFLYNLDGIQLMKGSANNYDLSGLKTGIYFLEVHFDGQRIVKKIIKE